MPGPEPCPLRPACRGALLRALLRLPLGAASQRQRGPGPGSSTHRLPSVCLPQRALRSLSPPWAPAPFSSPRSPGCHRTLCAVGPPFCLSMTLVCEPGRGPQEASSDPSGTHSACVGSSPGGHRDRSQQSVAHTSRFVCSLRGVRAQASPWVLRPGRQHLLPLRSGRGTGR